MKKLGTFRADASGTAGVSVDAVIAPEADEVAIEVLAERFDLSFEAPAQLVHQLGVDRWRGGALHAVDGGDRSMARATRRQRLDRRLDGAHRRRASEIDRTDEIVEAWRAHAAGVIGLDQLDRRRWIDIEEVHHPADRALVVGAEVL